MNFQHNKPELRDLYIATAGQNAAFAVMMMDQSLARAEGRRRGK